VRAAEARVAGKGVDKDVKGGIAQLDARCNKRDAMSCESLAKLYTNGSGQDVPADPPRGRQYSEKACGFGSKSSCGADGLRTQIDSARSDRARGRSIFQEGCDRGNAMDCGMLGELLLNGTAEDRAKAAALLRKGCDGGYDPACKKLGGGGAP
jgi:TPR repeat protein